MIVPEFFKHLLVEQYGEKAELIIDGLSKRKVLSFRVNTLKSNYENIEKILGDKKIEYKRVSWNENAFVIPDSLAKKEIENMEIYRNGEIYFQSLSSMIPPIVLNPKSKENILDMAAAPGGKTTQIAAMTNNSCFITACEKNKIRAERLKYNIEKQGVKNTYIMGVDSRKLDEMFSFDKILLDAPCSGSGTIDFSENIEKYFNLDLIKRSSRVQLELLNKAIKLLKKGNELVYSTCSILQEENENIINKVLEKNNVEVVPIDLQNFEEIPKLPTKIDGSLLVRPDEYYEGFFVVKLRKIR